MNPSYQLYVFVALMLFSGASALYRKLQEKKAIRDIEGNKRVRADEALRTGRDPGLAGNPARNLTDESNKARRERELAQARNQQEERLRQLRERIAGQQGQAQSSAPSQAQGPAGPQGVELWPGGPVVVVNPTVKQAPASGQRRAESQPQLQRRQEAQPMRPARPANLGGPSVPPRQVQGQPARGDQAKVPSQSRAKPQPKPQVVQQARSRDDSTPRVGRESMTDRAGTLAMTRRAEVEQAAESKLAELRRTTEIQRSGRLVPQTLDQWRAALVANEVLGVPMGLR